MKRKMVHLFLLISLIAFSASAQEYSPKWKVNAQRTISNNKIADPAAAMDAFTRDKGKGKFFVYLKARSIAADEPLQKEEHKRERRKEVNAARELAFSKMPTFPKNAVRYLFDYFFAFSVEVTPEELQLLIENPDVLSIEALFPLYPALAQGIPLMHGYTYRGKYDGQGLSVAVSDTGIDYSNPYLGGGSFPNFKVIGGIDIGENDTDPIDRDGHGTACAGIVAGALSAYNDYIGGVAYNAKLYALKISDSTGVAWPDATAYAWNWCITHQNDNPSYPIMIISYSFAAGKYTSFCDSQLSGLTSAALNAKAAGITIFAASGNDGYCNALAYPACIGSVISVGQVYDADLDTRFPCISLESCAPSKVISSTCGSGAYAVDNPVADMVASNSNSANFLDLLAPGYKAYTLGIGPSTFNTSFGGTSAATPYAAGAAAVLQSAARAKTGSWLTPDQVKYYLTTTGDSITDSKNGNTKPRVNLEKAIKALPSKQKPNLVPIISSLLLSDQASPLPSDSIQNGTFELGHTAWTEYTQQPGYEIIKTTFTGQVTPHSGFYAAWLGGVYSNTNYIRQSVTVPAALPYLTYYHCIASADSCGFDHGYVRINETNIDTLNLCSSSNTNGWTPKSINLSAYVGQTVSLEFRCVTDSTLNSNWFIDDVSFRTSGLGLSETSTFKISSEIDSSDATMPQKN